MPKIPRRKIAGLEYVTKVVTRQVEVGLIFFHTGTICEIATPHPHGIAIVVSPVVSHIRSSQQDETIFYADVAAA